MVIAGLLAVLSLGSVVAAPPPSNPNYQEFTVVCDGETLTAITNANSFGVPLHIEGETSVLIIVAFEATDADGNTVWIPVGNGKRTGQQGDLIICSAPHIDANAQILRTPR